MADKGGKGASMIPRGKGVKKTVAPPKQGMLKGKDDSLVKKTEHVQLDSSDSDYEGFIEEKDPSSLDVNGMTKSELKTGKKVSFESFKSGGKGDGGKGGKGFGVGNGGGKDNLPKAPINSIVTEVELKLELDLPKGSRLLMDCEAAEILQDIQLSITALSKDPKIKMPESFTKGLQYSKTNDHFKKAKDVREKLETLKMHGVTDGEICMIGNVCPETPEEVYALIPSLKANRHRNEKAITDVLAQLAKFKTSN